MKIKEIEQRTGIPSATIRYYEKEGLLKPERNQENNYRDYSESDIEHLEQIKVLRLLGITVEDVKKVLFRELELDAVMQKRLEQLNAEEKHLQEIRTVCENIIQRDMDITMLDEEVLGKEKGVWKEELERIFREDMTKVVLNQKGLNRHIMIMLTWGYLLSILMTFLVKKHFAVKNAGNRGDFSKGGTSMDGLLFYGVIFLAIFCGIAVHWTASVKVHVVILHISALMGPVILMFITSLYASADFQNRFCNHLPVIYAFMIGYIIVYWLVSERWKRFYNKDRYTVFMALFMTFIMTALTFLLTGEWLISLAAYLVMTIYVGLFWTAANRDKGTYNRYYAVVCANRIMNPIALMTSFYGRGTKGFYVGYNEDWNKTH